MRRLMKSMWRLVAVGTMVAAVATSASAQALLSFVHLRSIDGASGNVGFNTGFPTSNILLASQAGRRIRLTYLRVQFSQKTGASDTGGGLASITIRQVGYQSVNVHQNLASGITLASMTTTDARNVYELPLVANPGSSMPLHYFESFSDAAIAITVVGASAVDWFAQAQGYYLTP